MGLYPMGMPQLKLFCEFRIARELVVLEGSSEENGCMVPVANFAILCFVAVAHNEVLAWNAVGVHPFEVARIIKVVLAISGVWNENNVGVEGNMSVGIHPGIWARNVGVLV